jgi:hypothetical protein
VLVTHRSICAPVGKELSIVIAVTTAAGHPAVLKTSVSPAATSRPRPRHGGAGHGSGRLGRAEQELHKQQHAGCDIDGEPTVHSRVSF